MQTSLSAVKMKGMVQSFFFWLNFSKIARHSAVCFLHSLLEKVISEELCKIQVHAHLFALMTQLRSNTD